MLLDLADAHVGNPVLDGLRAVDYLPEPARPAAVQAWVGAWAAARPDSDQVASVRTALRLTRTPSPWPAT